MHSAQQTGGQDSAVTAISAVEGDDVKRSKPSLLASSGLVTLLSVAVSLVSFFNQLLIAKAFGVTEQITAYQVAVSAPMVVSGVLAASLSYAMVPLLVRRRLEDSDASGFNGAITLCLFVACASAGMIGLVFSSAIVDYLGRSLTLPMLELARQVARITWLTMSLTVLLAQLTAIQNSTHCFIRAVVAGAGPYVGMIVANVYLAKRYGIVAIAYGLLVGTLGGALLLLVSSRRELRLVRLTPSQSAGIRTFFLSLPAVILSTLIFTSFQSIDAFWAPQIGSSSLPTLGFGQRLIIAFGSLAVSGPSAVMSPRMAETAIPGRESDFILYMGKAVRSVLSFAAFIAVVVSVLARSIITVLFQRGRFDAAATLELANLLPWMMGGMAFMVCVVMLFGGFYARNSIAPTVKLSLATVIGYFVLSGLLSRPFGTPGIGAAYAVVWICVFLAALPTLWGEKRQELLSRSNLRFVGLLSITLCGTFLATWAFGPLLASALRGRTPSPLVQIVSGSFAGLAAFYILSDRVFRLEDARLIFEFLGRLARRALRRKNPG